MDSVFDVFPLTPYTFLEIARGGVAGNVIKSQTTAEGVFKLRSGMVSANNQETRQSDSTLHVKPAETFVTAHDSNLVGHGIRYQGRDYEITGQTAGQNFETSELEHYRLTLKAADFSKYGSL